MLFYAIFLQYNCTKNKGKKYPIFSIYDTFAQEKFENNDFHPYFYKGIVLKIGVKISENQSLRYFA